MRRVSRVELDVKSKEVWLARKGRSIEGKGHSSRSSEPAHSRGGAKLAWGKSRPAKDKRRIDQSLSAGSENKCSRFRLDHSHTEETHATRML